MSDILEYASVQEVQRILYSFRDFTNKFETCNNCECNGERDDVCFECYLDEFEKGHVEIPNHWEISNLREVKEWNYI